MNDRETLAARIEAATGPDRELDIAIGVFRREVEWRDGFLMKLHPQMGSTDEICHNPRTYTASIDAAMMLVPEGWRITHWSELGIGDGCFCYLGRKSLPSNPRRGDAKTMALALAAAAIRAGGV